MIPSMIVKSVSKKTVKLKEENEEGRRRISGGFSHFDSMLKTIQIFVLYAEKINTENNMLGLDVH